MPQTLDISNYKLCYMKKSKYQRFTPSGGKNIGISKSEFVTKTQFLSETFQIHNFFLCFIV